MLYNIFMDQILNKNLFIAKLPVISIRVEIKEIYFDIITYLL